MEWLNALWSRIRSLFHRRQLDADLEDELVFHLAMREEKYRSSGASVVESKQATRRDFGNLLQIKEACRRMRTFYPLELIWQDLRYAIRGLRRKWGFTFLVVLVLSLGIGSTTIGFGVVENLLFDPYPYKGADRLTALVIHGARDPGNEGRPMLSIPEFLDYRSKNHVFEDMVGSYDQPIVYTGPDSAQQFLGAFVTPNTFDFFGVPALLGRGITVEDGQSGAPPVFVMNYRLWKEAFAGDPQILGKTFTLNGQPRTLIGIMPPRFQAYGVRVWIPLLLAESHANGTQGDHPLTLWAIGRLKPGISLQTAAAELNVIAKGLAKIHPKDYPADGFNVLTMSVNDFVMGSFKITLFTLMAAVLMLLLIACSNAANLLLVRATTRDREMAIRAAIGAGRGRLLLQLLVEVFVLSVAGGIAGCLLAYYGLKAVVATIPLGPLPDEAVIGLNPVVLLLTLGVVIFTTLICGLAPALQAARKDLRSRLVSSSAYSDSGVRHRRFRASLVVTEVALSMLLLVGAGLMVRNLVGILRVDLGFDSSRILYARVVPASGFLDTGQQQRVFFDKVFRQIKALPGVISVAETATLPPLGGPIGPFIVPGKDTSDAHGQAAMMELCSEDYFKTMGFELLSGDLFSPKDVDSKAPVMVVNQTFVRQYFGDRDPIGQQIRLPLFDQLPDAPHNASLKIVGVISDFRNRGLELPPVPEMFLPYTLSGIGTRSIVVRTAVMPESLLPSIRKTVWATDPRVAFGVTGSIDSLLHHYTLRPPRFGVISLGTFAAVGLLLVMVGVFSVMTYTVSLQRHEFGIRIALGAQRGNLLRVVLLKGLRLIVMGIALGLLGSFGFVRFLASQIHGVPAADPLTLTSVALLLLIAGLSACLLPAQRATKVDPLAAIRHE
ncbi:MAG TPA: ABC transporter permease [Candidatus Angelobacter sp.]